MRWLIIILFVLLAGLQWRLWIGEGSLAHRAELNRQLQQQEDDNQALRQRNQLIATDVESLKTNLDAIEEKARSDLGMIKQGETFYLVIDKNNQPRPAEAKQ
ncbi:MAG: cell division protein FtsB [Porticoccaceae bacterium]|jgi:cell division protein FtsB|nr:cell division protein FtsB [Porticoccaceae bacterium]